MDEDDEDSLFGSPPPSPVRGRSPAFPAQAAQERGTGITQNVGAIALPGSHMSCSELPADLLALPFGGFSTREPPSHAVLVQNTLQAHLTQSPRVASSVPFSTSRPSSRAMGKRKTTKSQAATPRPAPPPIPLPGPNEPLPSNFLRNQEALLGIAGLVGNVKPISLPQQTVRGSTPSNPIIIEESDPTRLPHVDPNQFTSVNGEDAITSLIRQKNIYPVLSSIVKLLGNSPAASTQPPSTYDRASSRPCSEPATTAPPPLKRRKLTSVPAGAVEWDVPYPFPEGEGPEAYHATWERERVRHLISQLVESIKAASEPSPLDVDQVPPSSSQSSLLASEPSRRTLSPSLVSPTTTNTFQHIIPDSTIDPALLAISVPPSVTYNAFSPVPALVHSPITSTDSSDGALTPPAYNDQGALSQGSWMAKHAHLFHANDVDSVTAAKMLLQFAAKPTVPPPTPSHIDLSPAVLTPYPQTAPSHFSSLTQPVSPQISRALSVQSTHKSTPVVPRGAGFKAVHKEDILQRARERRRQIVGEIERAKVELWETSIEGGVLGHLMKDSTLS